jgi:NADH dehydrogenase
MANVLVIGGGFAGVWSAAGAMRTAQRAGAQLRVTLVAAGDDLVIRPRLYEDNPERMRVPLDRVLGPIGVRRVAATVTTIDTADRRVTAIRRDGTAADLTYDRLVLAAGSTLVPPAVDGAEHLFDVDTMPSAAALHAHLQRVVPTADDESGLSAVVVGAGFTGIEVATELVDRLRDRASGLPIRVVLVERAQVVGPELGEGPRPEILRALDGAGVEVRLGTSVTRVEETGVVLSDGASVPSRTVVWTAGMRANPLTEQVPGKRDHLGRLAVDEFLEVVDVPGVYAAGDTAAALAEPGQLVMQSCQHAVPQGKFAGVNVASDLLGLPRAPFAPDPYVTCLDLGSYGAVLTLGWDRVVDQTGAEAKALKRSINADWIYPPLDDAATILRHADHRTTWPTATVGQNT